MSLFCSLRVWCYLNIALFLLYGKIHLFCIQFHLQSYLTWTAPFVKIDAITDVHIHSLLFHESCFEYFQILFLLPSWYWIPVLHDDLLLKAAMVYVLESNHELGMHTVTQNYFFLFVFGTNISIVFAKMQTSRPPLSASEGKKARSIDQSKNRINHRIVPNESCFEYFLIRFLLPSWY